MLSKKISDFKKVGEYTVFQKDTLALRENYWKEEAEKLIWKKIFNKTFEEDFKNAKFSWFKNGKINFYENLTAVFDLSSEKTILTEFEDGTLKRKTSVKEFFKLVLRAGNHLKDNGLKKGDKLLFFLPNSSESIIYLFAAASLGITSVPVSIRYPYEFTLKVFEDSESSLILSDSKVKHPSYKEKINEIRKSNKAKTLDIQELYTITKSNRIQTELLEDFDSQAPLFIYYHSTGATKPKGYVYSAGGFAVHAKSSFDFMFHGDDSSTGTVFFDGELSSIPALAYAIWGTFLNGNSLAFSVMFDKSLNFTEKTFSLLQETITEHEPAFLLARPYTVASIKRNFKDRDILDKKFQKAVLYGDATSPGIIRFSGDKLTISRDKVLSIYMQRQTGVAVIANLPSEYLNKPGSMGYLMPAIDGEVVSALGQKCAPNESGHLVFKNTWPAMANTIYKQHDRFKKIHFSSESGFYDTRDGVRKDTEGCFWFMKKLDDILKMDGFSISTTEMETLITVHENVREAAAIGINKPDADDKVILFVAVKNIEILKNTKLKNELKNELNEYFKCHIGEFAVPYKIVFSKELPKTGTGKIVRRVLYRIATNDFDSNEDLSHISNPDSITDILEGGEQ